MKTRLSLLLLSLCLSAFGQGVLLGPGDSFSYAFTSMNYAGDIGGGPVRANFTAYFGGDLLDPGESVRLEMFENSVSGTPVASLDVTPSTTSRSRAEMFVTTRPLPWLDFQGAVRLTMLTGSTKLESIGMYTTDITSLYSVYTTVPEPSSLALLCIALAAGAVWPLKRR